MAKPKKSAGRGAVKKHGPKRKLFHEYSKCIRMAIAEAGLLSKYSCRESFELACQARGVRSVTEEMWIEFYKLPTKAAKDAWLKNLGK